MPFISISSQAGPANISYTGWGCQDAAHDLVAFMNALQLPPCHIMGLSMGARTAMQMSISYPERVLSLFLVSPIPIQEPEEVTQGRQEIYEVWTQAWTDPVNPDRETLTHAITGALQLAVNSASTPFIKAIVKTTMPYSLKQFCPGKFDQFHQATVEFFRQQGEDFTDKLSSIRCPVQLVYCGADVAYPKNHCEELLQALLDAGVDVDMEVVTDAPHFGTVTHAAE
ncbi:hypothetical protein H0H93_000748 [Arthromyces matolae]|nr:hypothetical protein H0H93_000748 [Arthromyces matolae]